jgi:hypothetical protein
MADRTIKINRAPVMTLWAAVVAERLGYDEEAALSLGKAVAGLNAQSKGRSLGIFGAKAGSSKEGSAKEAKKARAKAEAEFVTLLGRPVPTLETRQGLRAAIEGEAIDPAPVRKYLEGKFGEHLDEVRAAMHALARAYEPQALEARAFALYEQFRPAVARGKQGWGAAGELDLGLLRQMAKRRS